MIDYISFTALTTDKSKVQKHLLKKEVYTETGTVVYSSRRQKATNAIMRLKGDQFRWRGSIHKAYMGRTTGYFENITPFTHDMLEEQFRYLENTYALDLNTVRFTKVECGFNIKPARNVKDYLSSAICYLADNGHRYQLSKETKAGKPFLIKHDGDHYTFKAYDKCEDSHLDKRIREQFSNVLRLEIRLEKGAACFPVTYKDLMSLDKYALITNTLRTILSKIEFYDLPWCVSHLGMYQNGSALKWLAHILLPYAKGHEGEVIHQIEQMLAPSKKINDVKTAFQELLKTQPGEVDDVFAIIGLLSEFDRAIASYLGKEYLFDAKQYGIPNEADLYNGYHHDYDYNNDSN